jgi:hypothetical protein
MSYNGSDAMGDSESSERRGLRYNYECASDDDLRNSSRIDTKRIDTIEGAMTNVWNVINKYGNASLPSLDPNDADANNWKIDDDSPWFDVPAAMNEIVTARQEMYSALKEITGEDSGENPDMKWWEPYISRGTDTNTSYANNINHKNPNQEALSSEEQKQFEQVHMEWATNAFAEELEALRNGTLEQKFGIKKKRVEALELDPTEHSFVVAKKQSSNSNDELPREDVDVQVLADMIRSGGSVFSNVEKKMLLRARHRGGIVEEGKSLPIHELRRRKLEC